MTPANTKSSAAAIRIALFGRFGVGNLGNEASLCTALQQLRRISPGVQLTCICPEPAVVQVTYGIATLAVDQRPFRHGGDPGRRVKRQVFRVLRGLRLPGELISWYRCIRHMRTFDVLLIPGTGILDDFGVGPLEMPYELFKWCAAARLSGRPVYFVSVGAGPIRNRFSRWLMKQAVCMATYRSYRDNISKDFMQSIGLDTRRDVVYPDIVFGLEHSAKKRAIDASRPVIGVGVMAYYGWRGSPEHDQVVYQEYISRIGEFISWALSIGLTVRLLIGDTSCDQNAVTDILARLGEVTGGHADGQLIAEPIVSVEDAFAQIALTDLVVATRFHNVVFSLMLGKPVISLGYAKKNAALLEEMGLGQSSQDVDSLSVRRLIEQVESMLPRIVSDSARVAATSNEYRTAIRRQCEVIGERLGPS